MDGKPTNFETLVSRANQEAVADASRPAFDQVPISNELNSAMVGAPKQGLELIAEGIEITDPREQIAYSQSKIQEEMLKMFENEPQQPGIDQMAMNAEIAANTAADPALFAEFEKILKAKEVLDIEAGTLTKTDSKAKLQFLISALVAAGGLVATAVRGPNYGTFLVAASVLRVVQTFPKIKEEGIYNALVTDHKDQIATATQKAEARIREVIAGLDGREPTELELRRIYKIVSDEAEDIEFVKALLKKAKEAGDAKSKLFGKQSQRNGQSGVK